MTTNKYDALYENMKNRFTVVNNGSEYTLGDFMRMKAAKKQAEAAATSANLPVVTKSRGERAVAQIVSFVSDKLTIKNPPAKDKTIRSFPLRTSLSALLSAVVTCSFVLCFCVIGARILNLSAPAAEEAAITEHAPEIEVENYLA